jgi:hypothetical protein
LAHDEITRGMSFTWKILEFFCVFKFWASISSFNEESLLTMTVQEALVAKELLEVDLMIDIL